MDPSRRRHLAYITHGIFCALASTLAPSCLVSFRDWPDGNGQPSGGTAAGSSDGTTMAGAGGVGVGATLGAASTTIQAGGTASTRALGQGGFTSTSSAQDTRGGAATATRGGQSATTPSAGTSSVASGGTAGIGTGGTASLLSARGGSSSVSSASGGTAGIGTATGSNQEQVRWLIFQASRASASEPSNAGLGIDGELRIESDECADVSFDRTTRCISGNLCTYTYENQYWGAALVFDFVSVGAQRFRWDPRSYDATGVAYRILGSQIPKLQLWVLDMDTTAWPGACSGSPCEIVGPPYGDASIGTAGSLYFDAMVPDDWNGTGINYVHQPANTLSLQFKIPAVMVGAAAFEFCLDQLGILVQPT